MEASDPTGGDAARDFLCALSQTVQRQTGMPGLAVAVRSPEHFLVVSVGRGCADRATELTSSARFQIGCIAKLLTATVVAQLTQEGMLDVEAPVEYYLPELSRNSGHGRIQVSHLLCHTSGYSGPGLSLELGDPAVGLETSWRRFVEFFRGAPQLFEPGTVFSYEHTEHVILGEIVRRLSGRDIEDHYRDRILEILNLHAGLATTDATDVAVAEHEYRPATRQWTTLPPAEHNRFWRASISDWTLSVSDLCLLARILLSDPEAALGVPTSTFLTTPAFVLPPTSPDTCKPAILPRSFTYGCALYHGGVLGQGGSARGQVCGVRAHPTSNTVVAVAFGACHPILRDLILDRVTEYFCRGKAPADPVAGVPIDPAELAGCYVGVRDIHVIVRCAAHQLVAAIVKAGAAPHYLTFDIDREARLLARDEAPVNTIRFFRSSHTGELGLMLGMTAFRKETGE